ncbi:glycosyltransferase [Arcicella aquatica]|uniref:Glycosyltransferase n=1 Tax=Arcicella aquatica TaxID=217141 RepID=A0ABU5QN12_9BACT|nr:glycosyltransferase [Arcicella aquatica]MEA5258457.1 glycosyltransferase [Arcicella aquatica]
MNILIQHNALLPVSQYGGTERMVWWLGKYLNELGHKVTFLVKEGSSCPFAKVLPYDENKSINEQIPNDIDIVHLNSTYEATQKPQIVTVHGNPHNSEKLAINTVFVSKNHAERHGGEAFVYNGIDFDEYGKPDFNLPRKHLHFLAKAAWRVKNVKGAIEIAKRSHHKLVVMGGSRLNFKMGFRFTPDLNVRFHGMIGGQEKLQILNQSKALLFPVLWHEPFGLAIVESLYMGSAVFGTTYGSLPELIHPEVGFLSNHQHELVEQLKNVDHFSPKLCHEYAQDVFSAKAMTEKYITYYETVLAGKPLNSQTPKALESYPKFLPFSE